MSADLAVRGLAESDAAPVARLHAAAMLPLGEAGWHAGDILTLLRSPGVAGVLAEDRQGGPPHGFVLYRVVMEEAEILTLAVSPEVQRQGIGLRLLREAAARAVAGGAARLFLEVSILNGPAQALYSTLGFERLGVRKGYYSLMDGRRVDALVLGLRLAAPERRS